MEGYLKKAEECLKKADQENDISERYALLRKAEIYVWIAQIKSFDYRMNEVVVQIANMRSDR